MLLTLDVLRAAVYMACEAYRRFVPAPAVDVSRLEWCCGCVSVVQRGAGMTVWTDQTRCRQHADEPLRTVFPPLGVSDVAAQ